MAGIGMGTGKAGVAWHVAHSRLEWLVEDTAGCQRKHVEWVERWGHMHKSVQAPTAWTDATTTALPHGPEPRLSTKSNPITHRLRESEGKGDRPLAEFSSCAK